MINLYDKVTEWRIIVSYMQLIETAKQLVLYYFTALAKIASMDIPFPRDIRKEETSWKSNPFSEEHLILVNLRTA